MPTRPTSPTDRRGPDACARAAPRIAAAPPMRRHLLLGALLAVLAAGATAQSPAPPVAGTPGAPTGVQGRSDWPQVVSADGRSFRVFDPLFSSMAGGEVGLQMGVQRVAADGTVQDGSAAFGMATLLAQAVPGAEPGQLEVTSFTVQSLVFASGVAPQDEIDALQAAIGGKSIGIPRAALLQDMQLQNARQAGDAGLGIDTPAFRFVDRPSVLVSFDGPPMWRDLGNTGWRAARNTPYAFLQSPDGGFAVQLGDRWARSMDFDSGYAAGDAPPAEVLAGLGPVPQAPGAIAQRAVSRAQAAGQSTDGGGAAAAPPAAQAGADAAAGATVPAPAPALPEVVVAQEATVLLCTDGAPDLRPIAPGMQSARNSSAVLVHMDEDDRWWTIASGRWFTAPAVGGPWVPVPPAKLPATLMLLPADRRHAPARASVPGTREANAAVAAAQEMRTVTLARAAAKCSVSYAGDPVFTGVDGTLLRWCVNASQPVIECDRTVYCCDNGAWFVASDATGPWSPCDAVPDAIYAIPSSNPLYPVTSVEVVGAGPDSVTYGYTPAYFGTVVWDGTVAYGSGFVNQAFLYGDNGYVALPQTYGRTMVFDADTGTFAPPTDAPFGMPQPAARPAVLTGGWNGWGWCPGWTSAWGWGWNHPEWWGHWGSWWNQFNPYWNHWWDAQHIWKQEELQAEADREAAADAARAQQEEAEAQDQAQRQAAEQAAERARVEARERLAAEQDRARAEEARFRDMRTYDQIARDRAQAAYQARLQGPTAKPGTWDWWYQYYNDLSNGYLSQATGFRDPRWPVQR